MELADFLLARIAEDESAARAMGVAWFVRNDGFRTPNHAARRMMDAEARRHLVELSRGPDGAADPVDDDALGLNAAIVLRNLGLTYAYHPDYRNEWRP